ncbi:MAG: AsmA-like C-terminal domain-containing protein [Desulfarculaceae bacterium]|nr:AsmA-like C-terminal domain-containing protein [Desulfarculaceae bacterium]
MAAVLFLFIAAALSTPFLVNSDYVKDRLTKSIASETGMDIRFSEISLSFFTGFHIAFRGIRAGENQSLSDSIGGVLVYPDVSSLIKGRVLITKVVLQDVETGKLIEQSARKKDSLRKTLSPLSIRNAIARFEPFIRREKGIEIALENFDTSFFTGVDTSVLVRSDNGGIAGKGRLENLEIKEKTLQSLIPTNRQLPSVKTDTADIRFTVDEKGSLSGQCKFRNLAIRSANESGLTLNPEEATVTFDISATKSAVRLKADSLAPVLQNPEISFVRTPGIPSTTLKFSGEKVNLGQAETYANAFIGKNAISRNIFRIIESGVSPEIEVAFENNKKSGLFDPENLIIQGKIQSGKVNIPESGLTARNVSGSAFMKDGTLDIEVAKGNVRNSEIHQGTVSVELLAGPEVPFTAAFSLTADLRNVPAALQLLIDNKPFAEEISRVAVSKGSARVDLYLAKKRKKELTVRIKAEDIRLEGRYDRMNDRIEIFDGSLSYKNETVRIDRLTAKSGDSYLYDTCMDFRFGPEPTVHIKSGKALFQIQELFSYPAATKVFPAESPAFSVADGTIFLDAMDLTLPFKKKAKREFMITGKAKDVKTAVGSEKEEAFVLSFDFTASQKGISLSGLTGRLEDLGPVFELSGSPLVKGIRPPISILEGRVAIEPDGLFFTGKFDFPSGPAVTLAVHRTAQGKFTLERLSVADPPATRFDFQNTGEKASFEGFMSSGTIEKLFTKRFLSESGFFRITGEDHFLVSSGDDSFLKLAAYRLDLTPVLNRKNEYQDLRQWLSDKPIRIKTRYFDTGRYRLNKVSALLDIKPDQTVVRLEKADLCGMNINGTIVKKGNFIEYQAETSALEKDDFRYTADCLFSGEALMDGSYSFEGRFHSKTAKKHLKETVYGHFEFSASNGRIYRLTLLSRILSVINVSRFLEGSLPDILQDGFAFNTVSLKAYVKDSRITVKEGIIDGTDMSIIFTGDVFPVQQKIDMTFLVAPFKTVDMIVKKIPVLNTLLGGKLVSIPVKAEGNFENPAVIPLHPSSVGKGLTNMMKNIVNTPVKLMEKLP